LHRRQKWTVDWGGLEWIVDCSGSEWTIVSWTVKYSMSVLTQLSVPGEARLLKIALEAIYTSSYWNRFALKKYGNYELILKKFSLWDKIISRNLNNICCSFLGAGPLNWKLLSRKVCFFGFFSIFNFCFVGSIFFTSLPSSDFLSLRAIINQFWWNFQILSSYPRDYIVVFIHHIARFIFDLFLGTGPQKMHVLFLWCFEICVWC